MNIAPDELSMALKLLDGDDLVGMPTETVYGLAGNAESAAAVAKIYGLKGRPSFNPLIAHIAGMEMAQKQAEFSELALRLADAFWPGPLTLVLPSAKTNSICDLARADLDTQALRWPGHTDAQTLIREFGRPIAAPSANKSGRISPTTASHVRGEFGSDLKLVLDGGDSVLGLESTVIAVLNETVTLLRPGSIPSTDIESVCGKLESAIHDDHAPKSPGMLSRHYSPDAKVRLNVTEPAPDEAFLAFGSDHETATLNLSPSGDLQEAAANLYAMLRELDASFSSIAIAPIPDAGLGEAINDRLRRAAL